MGLIGGIAHPHFCMRDRSSTWPMNCPSHLVFNSKSHTNCLTRTASLIHIYTQQVFLDHKMLELESFRSRLAWLVIQRRHFFHNFFDKWSPIKTGSVLVLDSSGHNPCLLLCFFFGASGYVYPSPTGQPFTHLVAANLSQLSFHQVCKEFSDHLE